jgi:acyl carrier protein
MANAIGTEERAALASQIARILLRHSDADLTESNIPPQTALIDTGFNLSSVNLLEALVEIEQALHVRLTDEALTVEVLSSFALFVDHVCNLIPPASGNRSAPSHANRA